MYCAQCGNELTRDARYCHKCGAVVARIHKAEIPPDTKSEAPASQDVSAPTSASREESSEDLKGVKGWLLFLCWILTVVSPVIMLWQIGMEWKVVSPAFAALPNLRTIVVVDTAHNVLMMAFSIWAGVSLWRLKPNAVRIAKTYFVFALIFSIAIPFFLEGLVELPYEISRANEKEEAKQVIRGVMSSVIWLWYLSTSKRVRATYAR